MIDASATPYRVSGPMTYATAAELLAQGKALITANETAFDLAGVSVADSASLAVILGWQRAAGKGGVLLHNLPENIRSLAQLYGVADLLPVPPSS